MMKLGSWFRPPRHALTIFVALGLVSAGALIFLVRLLLAQDRAVEVQLRQERLEQAADRAVIQMSSALALLDQRTIRGGPNVVLPAGLVDIGYDPLRLGDQPLPGLLYYPDFPRNAATVDDDPRLIEAERLEFAERNPAAAAALYEKIATDAKPAARLVALNRWARALRKTGNIDGALRVYDRIEPLANTRIEGLPAGLLARIGRASIFEAANRGAELSREATALGEDLGRGRWRLVRSEYVFYTAQMRKWLQTTGVGATAPEDTEATTRADAAAWMWKEKPWQNLAAGSPPERRLIRINGEPVLAVWSAESAAGSIVIASHSYFAPLCSAGIGDSSSECALTDAEGHAIAGTLAAAGALTAIRTPASAGLPWGLQVSPGPASSAAVSPQRSVLTGLLAVVAAVWLVGMAFIVRALVREIRVSRMQSDFVAAVSHEFRSPLSTISQISELFLTDRLPSEALRQKAFGLLAHEAARLRSLVEGLLEFGRLESGRAVYQFEEIDLGSFLASLVTDFGARVSHDGYRIELDLPASPVTARVDREALTRAVTNLLDNAVKYSPECKTVWMDLGPMDAEADRVGITVRDHGIGIPESEQRDIFERFVRGSNSKALRIKGTGIGLATALHIARAHGGKIVLSSAPGEGSRFTIVLPHMSG
jgi:signal transduction histidine kinase